MNAVLPKERNVFLGEIAAHDTDEFHRTEEARSHSCMTRGTSEEFRVFGFRGFNGIQGGGTYD